MNKAEGFSTDWFFVTHDPLHILKAKVDDISWWCVDKRAKPGDRAFLYQPRKGILIFFAILGLSKPELFCSSFSMNTAKIKILHVFEPPITGKRLKSTPIVMKELFVRANFQRKSFIIASRATTEKILSLTD